MKFDPTTRILDLEGNPLDEYQPQRPGADGKPTPDKKIETKFSNVIGNALQVYDAGHTPGWDETINRDDLARRILRASGPIELTGDEINTLRGALLSCMKRQIMPPSALAQVARAMDSKPAPTAGESTP